MAQDQSDPYERAINALLSADEPTLVFVGHPSRTWFTDRDRLRSLIGDLYVLRAFSVVHGGRLPFDMYVQEICDEFNIPCELVGPQEQEIRLSVFYERDPDLAAVACLLVAFPAEDHDEKKAYPPESADSGVVRNAKEGEIPVLSVRRSGEAEWV